MRKLVLALTEAFKALFSFKILLCLVAPLFFSVFLGLILFFFFWEKASRFIVDTLTQTWVFDYISRLAAHDFTWIAWGIAAGVLILLFIPISYFFSIILSQIFVMPIVQRELNRKYFPQLEIKNGGSLLGSLWNSFVSSLGFIVAFVLTFPLWLIPGLQILLPMIYTGWLNRRLFTYDSLADHASSEECKKLFEANAGTYYGIGFLGAVLMYIPFLSFFAPVFTGIVFHFYCLRRLEELRRVDLDPPLV